MMVIKVRFENGDTLITKINATLEESKKYYVGNYFNLGTVSDYMQKALMVEVLKNG